MKKPSEAKIRQIIVEEAAYTIKIIQEQMQLDSEVYDEDDNPYELGRTDGAMSNMDKTLYSDNPDYQTGYDEVSIDVRTKHAEVPPAPEDGIPGDDENTPDYDGPIRESKSKKRRKKKDSKTKEHDDTSGKYWYLGHLEKDYEPCNDWSKFGFAPVEEEEE